MTLSGLIPTESWKKFLKKTKRAPKIQSELIKDALINSGELIVARSKGNYLTGAALNVRTGRLRASVSRSAVNKIGFVYYINVGTNVFYGKYWETGFFRGSRYMAPRRWLRPAFTDSRTKIRTILRKIGVSLFSGRF